ncbi:hypothetical protein LJR030_002485 [Rhizobium sp. LjRoot30]|uniref:hypothetical protein n=1 Tax=Rhizobium sp. LjRoot30 TaxID=3342320 RepID=UPI003ECC7474
MMHITLSYLFLSIAAGLSVRRFALPYLPDGNIAEQRAPITTVATAVFLATIALIVSDQQLLAISIIMGLGILLAAIFDNTRSELTTIISAVSLMAYLGLRSVG